MQQPSNHSTIFVRIIKEETGWLEVIFYVDSACGAKQDMQVIHSRLKGTCGSGEDNNE